MCFHETSLHIVFNNYLEIIKILSSNKSIDIHVKDDILFYDKSHLKKNINNYYFYYF